MAAENNINTNRFVKLQEKTMRIFFTFLLSVGPVLLQAQERPDLRHADKIRIREAIRISASYGDTLFERFHAVPFALLLVTDSLEFLINHPSPAADFTFLGKDAILETEVYYRKTQFPPHLLATFPAVNGHNTIVVGTPENTGKHSAAWILTLLHEHFHQYQQASPGYYASVEGLGLSGGDQTGMWMLNYPFPYEHAAVRRQYASYSKALHRVLTRPGRPVSGSLLKKYRREREKLQKLLGPADYRYLSFQIWQEGLARYTEYKFLELLEGYRPTQELRALPDFIPFPEYKKSFYEEELRLLRDVRLAEARRVSFYTLGFAEGLLLDRLNKDWRRQYRTEKFYIEKYFQR